MTSVTAASSHGLLSTLRDTHLTHSLCDDSGSQIGGGVTCHSTWQTGIAAGQVLDRDWQELYDATREVYPNHSVDEVIRWTAGKWATPTQQRYIYADMRSELAKSWAIRNPALGFELVSEHEVANDCLNAVERPWNCFVNRRRRSTDQSRKYAKTQQLSNQVISDLSSAIYGLL